MKLVILLSTKTLIYLLMLSLLKLPPLFLGHATFVGKSYSFCSVHVLLNYVVSCLVISFLLGSDSLVFLSLHDMAVDILGQHYCPYTIFQKLPFSNLRFSETPPEFYVITSTF